MLSPDRVLLDRCAADIAERDGPIALQSPTLPWQHTAYYEREMGTGLLRRFVAFSANVDPGILPGLKQDTVRWEEQWSAPGSSKLQRRINLDPGYVTEAKVVVATTKDFPHRIYIGGGIYAEAALHYVREHQSFTALPHTYPDFLIPDVLRFFNAVRELLRKDLLRDGRTGARTDNAV